MDVDKQQLHIIGSLLVLYMAFGLRTSIKQEIEHNILFQLVDHNALCVRHLMESDLGNMVLITIKLEPIHFEIQTAEMQDAFGRMPVRLVQWNSAIYVLMLSV